MRKRLETTMATEVFIWDNKYNTGHASMQIGNQYISFHPDEADLMALLTKAHPTTKKDRFESDCRKSNSMPTDTVRLYELHEHEMLDYYSVALKTSRYSFWNMNCSTICGKLLILGFTQRIADHWSFEEIYEKLKWSFFTPKQYRSRNLHGRVTEHAIKFVDESLLSAARVPKTLRTKSVQRFLLASVATTTFQRLFVWTPGEVLAMANYISEHEHHLA